MNSPNRRCRPKHRLETGTTRDRNGLPAWISASAIRRSNSCCANRPPWSKPRQLKVASRPRRHESRATGTQPHQRSKPGNTRQMACRPCREYAAPPERAADWSQPRGIKTCAEFLPNPGIPDCSSCLFSFLFSLNPGRPVGVIRVQSRVRLAIRQRRRAVARSR